MCSHVCTCVKQATRLFFSSAKTCQSPQLTLVSTTSLCSSAAWFSLALLKHARLWGGHRGLLCQGPLFDSSPWNAVHAVRLQKNL